MTTLNSYKFFQIAAAIYLLAVISGNEMAYLILMSISVIIILMTYLIDSIETKGINLLILIWSLIISGAGTIILINPLGYPLFKGLMFGLLISVFIYSIFRKENK